MDTVSESRLALVHPVLRSRVEDLVAALQVEGYTVRVTAGIRTAEQQDELYAQGRTTPGPKVTNAQGTQSNHVMGWAVDLAFMVNGEPDWNSRGFDLLPDLAPKFGLRSGASWGDRPHLELAEVPTEPTPLAQQTYSEAGVEQVWREFPIEAA